MFCDRPEKRPEDVRTVSLKKVHPAGWTFFAWSMSSQEVDQVNGRMGLKLLLCTGLLAGLGCAGEQRPEPGTIPGTPGSVDRAPASGSRAFSGRIVRMELEGGFWGIISDQGERFDPMNLPRDYRQEGLLVNGHLVVREDMAGTHMWGRIVEIKDISKAVP